MPWIIRVLSGTLPVSITALMLPRMSTQLVRTESAVFFWSTNFEWITVTRVTPAFSSSVHSTRVGVSARFVKRKVWTNASRGHELVDLADDEDPLAVFAPVDDAGAGLEVGF